MTKLECSACLIFRKQTMKRNLPGSTLKNQDNATIFIHYSRNFPILLTFMIYLRIQMYHQLFSINRRQENKTATNARSLQMKLSRMLLCIGLFLIAASSVTLGRSILERKVFYLTAAPEKSGQAKYWVVFLGNHEITLTRKYPGEEPQKAGVSPGDVEIFLKE